MTSGDGGSIGFAFASPAASPSSPGVAPLSEDGVPGLETASFGDVRIRSAGDRGFDLDLGDGVLRFGGELLGAFREEAPVGERLFFADGECWSP